MDGIDWMSVAEFAPVAGALAVFGLFGWIGPVPAVVAAALLGAILGFAPFNRPVAKLFLGDVGSLPLGLLLGWLLLELAAKGHAAAALILPLYYLADATATLVRRIATGEPFWRPHRTHFYQRATDRGFTVPEIINRVFAVNLALAALALVTVTASTRLVSAAALVAAAVLVAGLLLTFVRGRR
jgi:UDP-N-acetylmuramyl pentapeptide phosphotransferase/UDP-N-acetylglucosamine-1-phosphate transferase